MITAGRTRRRHEPRIAPKACRMVDLPQNQPRIVLFWRWNRNMQRARQPVPLVHLFMSQEQTPRCIPLDDTAAFISKSGVRFAVTNMHFCSCRAMHANLLADYSR